MVRTYGFQIILGSRMHKCLSNLLNYPNKSDDYEMIYVEDPYTGKVYETAKSKDDTEDFEEDEDDGC